MAVLGSKPAAQVVVNEMTTVASVWTNAQFLDGAALKGYALGLKIAAGNVPNFQESARTRPRQWLTRRKLASGHHGLLTAGPPARQAGTE